MTDLQVYVNFIRLMGLIYYPVNIGDAVIIYSDDTKTADNVKTRGYDEIYFLAKFDSYGNMIESYIVSHVCGSPAGYNELFFEWDRAFNGGPGVTLEFIEPIKISKDGI